MNWKSFVGGMVATVSLIIAVAVGEMALGHAAGPMVCVWAIATGMF